MRRNYTLDYYTGLYNNLSVAVGEKWYAIVAADEEALDGVQLINISDPAKPKPAGVGADALAQGLCCLCQQSA